MIQVWGRVLGNEQQNKEILKKHFDLNYLFACQEEPDSGCTSAHCHFIGFNNHYKNLKTLRDAFAQTCKKVLGKTGQYQLKPFEPDKLDECLRYMCKDVVTHLDQCEDCDKCMAFSPRNIIYMGFNKTEDDCHNYHIKFWDSPEGRKYLKKMQEKRSKSDKAPFWKKIYEYITDNDPKLFDKCNRNTPTKIASHVYDYFEQNEKFLQNDRFIELTIKTIMIQAYKTKTLRETLKNSMIENWTSNFSQLSYFEYSEESDSEDL